ncbi:hypothetical protein C8R47DRAFT_144069 [Mycena vitilis]|nr:hypothetical protein C8R47DRAFT_144069 [Mycena vitilis]
MSCPVIVLHLATVAPAANHHRQCWHGRQFPAMLPPSSFQSGPTDKRPRKLSACNPCKARRVLCHPQPGGSPCPRCVGKNTICTTTYVPRARPPKNRAVQPSPGSARPRQTAAPLVLHPRPNFESSSDCPEFSPEFVAHCFEGMSCPTNTLSLRPTSITSQVGAVSFQLNLLSPETRVLALCSIAYASLSCFHPFILGAGSRPESFLDQAFFSPSPDLLGCGVRRAPAYCALRSEALKAAWDIGVILLPSNTTRTSLHATFWTLWSKAILEVRVGHGPTRI